MLAYASANMTKKAKKALDKAIKEYKTKGSIVNGKRVGAGRGIENWKGVDDPSSIEAWRNAPDNVRKELKSMMDVNFRNEGGLSIGEARLAVADPTQLVARDSGVHNVGKIDSAADIIQDSGHPSYPQGLPGEGMGRIKEDVSIFEMLPDLVKERGIVDPKEPRATDIRAMQMKPYGGLITEQLLKDLGF
jgi:hypothetical protein